MDAIKVLGGILKTMSRRIAKQNGQLGHRIADIRKSRGISQGELAKRIGQTQRVVSYYETGITRIPAEELLKVTQALKASWTEIVGQKGTPETKKDRNLWKLVRQLENLPPKKRTQVTEYIELLSGSQRAA